jgi:hypothetical protein
MRDRVRKKKGAERHGRIVGFYSTEKTKKGYAVKTNAKKARRKFTPGRRWNMTIDATIENDDNVIEAKEYRKKPLVVKAFQLIWDEVSKNDKSIFPDWFNAAIEEKRVYVFRARMDESDVIAVIYTSEYGEMSVSDKDYIILSEDGFISACKPDIFALTYEPVTYE